MWDALLIKVGNFVINIRLILYAVIGVGTTERKATKCLIMQIYRRFKLQFSSQTVGEHPDTWYQMRYELTSIPIVCPHYNNHQHTHQWQYILFVNVLCCRLFKKHMIYRESPAFQNTVVRFCCCLMMKAFHLSCVVPLLQRCIACFNR